MIVIISYASIRETQQVHFATVFSKRRQFSLSFENSRKSKECCISSDFVEL